MGKQKQIGLENYLKLNSITILTQYLSVRTLKIPKSKQTLTFYTITAAFTNEFMGKQKQIGLEKPLKFD